MYSISLKQNFEEAKQHFREWWGRQGLVAAQGSGIRNNAGPAEPETLSAAERHTDIEYKVKRDIGRLERNSFPLDSLPIADTNMGPGSLATFIGSEPGFDERTVWFNPCIGDVERPEELPPITFDENNKWWRLTEELLKQFQKAAEGKFIVGCPDLVENIDILGSLRDSQTLMIDMIERPDWVAEKVIEINRVWFEAYDRIYDIIKLPDASSAFSAFHLWGPGKTAKLQCDASAMFSPGMFKRFVVPALTEQCERLDYSLYHLDGTQCICHLDLLLEIDALDAVEWTPQAGIEGGGDPRWYDMYKKILAAGKSVQIIGIDVTNVEQVLDAVGAEGVYLAVGMADEREAEIMSRKIEAYR